MMSPITSKERVYKALAHQLSDRVPLFYRDVPAVEQRLLRDLNLPDRGALLQHFDIDFRWVEPRYVGPELQDDETGRIRNIWGVAYQYENSGRGGYWSAAAFPLQNAHDSAQLDDYPWPQLAWFDFSHLARDVAAYRDYAIMTAPGNASPGIASVIQDLIGMERMLLDPMMNPAFFDALVEKIVAFVAPFVERMFSEAGGQIDFFRIGDDFGAQNGLMMSVEQWQRSYAPALKAISTPAKKYGAKYYHHSCGGIRELIPSLIELGVDVLDPIQVQAEGMEPAYLKRAFGDRLVFSGGIDEQHILPEGTPEEVRREVFRMCDIMGRDGGYFVGSTHNFQEDIPTDNIVAMYEAAREWRP